jgi:hypothetical protein
MLPDRKRVHEPGKFWQKAAEENKVNATKALSGRNLRKRLGLTTQKVIKLVRLEC